jgi:hypothetical protein
MNRGLLLALVVLAGCCTRHDVEVEVTTMAASIKVRYANTPVEHEPPSETDVESIWHEE